MKLSLKGKESPRLDQIRKERTKAQPEPAKVEKAAKRKSRLSNELLKLLETDHPIVFDREDPIVLTVGIHRAIRKQYPEFPNHIISLAMHRWCRRRKYQAAIMAGGARHSLDGHEVEPITDDQVAHAKEGL